MRRAKRARKNTLAVIVFALLLAFLVTAGTMAWLTRTSSITNRFTVGTFTSPTTNPLDPTETISIDGNLYEPSWDANDEHRLIPSVSFAKDPYVGIGPGSEDAVVYVNVENNLSNKVYFALNNGWEPVLGHVTAGSLSGTYTSGLFKYTAGLALDPENPDVDVWTTAPLFSTVNTAEDANFEDFTPAAGADAEITVSSFLHQAKNSAGVAIDSDVILNAAIAAFAD